MSANFRPGQKVVCINAERTNKKNIPELEVGRIYTLRWVGRERRRIVVRLEEVARVAFYHGDIYLDEDDTPFLASRFRPLVSSETDITVFKSILQTTRQMEEA